MSESEETEVSVSSFARRWRIRRFLFLTRYYVLTLLPFAGWPAGLVYFGWQDDWIGVLCWLFLYPANLTYFAGWLLELLRYAISSPTLSVNSDDWEVSVSKGRVKVSDGRRYCKFHVDRVVRIWERNPKETPEIEMPTLLTILELTEVSWLPIPNGTKGIRDLFSVIDECSWIEKDITYD